MTTESDARQDLLDAVERLRGLMSLLPAVRVQRQYEFEQLLDLYMEVATEDLYNGGVSDGKHDGFDLGKEEGHNEGLVEGREEGERDGDEAGYARGYDQGKAEGSREGDEEGYERGYRTGFDAAGREERRR